MNAQSPRRLLIVKPSSFGDIIHTLPALDALRRHWPGTCIDWLVKDEWSELLLSQPALGKMLLLPRNPSGWRHLATLLRQHRYDMVIDFQGLFRSGVASWLSRAPRRIGFADAREGSGWFYTERIACDARAHAVDRALQLLEGVGVPARTSPRFPFSIPQASLDWAAALLGRERTCGRDVVVIHPAARWKTKCWPAENFARLADSLAADGARIFLVAGAPERGQADAVSALACHPPVNLAGQCTVLELAALLEKANLVISNDSGPMHLAAALDTPVIGLFGPTDPHRVGPYGRGHMALKKQFDCSACHRSRCARNQGCMQAISVGEVIAAARSLLGGKRVPQGAGAH
jgi:lipopolysaccharide heptosyltransferase I